MSQNKQDGAGQVAVTIIKYSEMTGRSCASIYRSINRGKLNTKKYNGVTHVLISDSELVDATSTGRDSGIYTGIYTGRAPGRCPGIYTGRDAGRDYIDYSGVYPDEINSPTPSQAISYSDPNEPCVPGIYTGIDNGIYTGRDPGRCPGIYTGRDPGIYDSSVCVLLAGLLFNMPSCTCDNQPHVGHVKLHRKLLENNVTTDPLAFSVLVEMFMLANNAGIVNIENKTRLHQSIGSKEYAAALSELENTYDIVKINTDNNKVVVVITNWNKYQYKKSDAVFTDTSGKIVIKPSDITDDSLARTRDNILNINNINIKENIDSKYTSINNIESIDSVIDNSNSKSEYNSKVSKESKESKANKESVNNYPKINDKDSVYIPRDIRNPDKYNSEHRQYVQDALYVYDYYDGKIGRKSTIIRTMMLLIPLLSEYSKDDLVTAVDNYSKEVMSDGRQKKYCLTAQSFFLDRYYDYIPAEYEKGKKIKQNIRKPANVKKYNGDNYE